MIKTSSFCKLSNGMEINLYTFTNTKGNQVKVTNYGARVVSWSMHDKSGSLVDVVLGYDDAAVYEQDDKYMGAIVGRCANRIGAAQFTLNGEVYQLDKNDNGKNHLHGGFSGFEKKVWHAELLKDVLKLTCTSADGEGGYPGNIEVTVNYEFSNNDELKISYEAVADEDTVCNLTNHTYFNLNGFNSGDILSQRMQIFADNYTWSNEESIPDGRIMSVANTPMDLRKLTRIGEHIDDDFDVLNFGHGYDHNWCLNNFDGTLKKAAHVECEESGIKLTVYTTLPGIQFYAGNFLDGKPAGKGGAILGKRSGFALEAQYYPNAINIPAFHQPILRKGDIYKAQTVYALSL